MDACPCARRGHTEASAWEAWDMTVTLHGEAAEIPEGSQVGLAVLGELPQCNGRCGIQGYGEDAHPDFDRDCPIHGDEADENREWCVECKAGVGIIERSIEASGYMEREREYHVTRLSCGHEIAVEVKRR